MKIIVFLYKVVFVGLLVRWRHFIIIPTRKGQTIQTTRTLCAHYKSQHFTTWQQVTKNNINDMPFTRPKLLDASNNDTTQ